MRQTKNWCMILLWFAVNCISCRDREAKTLDSVPSTKLDGIYDVVRITCDYPVDLDHDGTLSNDLLAETHEASNMSRYYAEFNTEIYHWEPDFYYQRIFLWIPFTNVFQDEAGNFLDVKYGFTNLLAKYQYDETTRQVSILGNLGNGEVVGGRLISEDTLFIQFKAYFYSTKGWETLPLSGVYNRRR